uniref:Uncharacterized protein n=1 Tax=Brassica oleracea var. oleracea TaxID=109376 RepID=A0A0D3D3W8_BRAOL
MDQTDQNVPDVPVEVHLSDQIRQTNRAMYRLDPRMSGLELRPDPRPDARTDRTEARLSRPTRQAKADGQAIIHLGRASSDSDHGFSFGSIGSYRMILKLSEDLGFMGTQLVRSERPAALADRPAYVLIPTALDTAGSDASGRKPISHFD